MSTDRQGRDPSRNRVVFYIPPSAEEAKKAGRKMKHLPHFRGLATITTVPSDTTYEMTHHGRTYKRSVQELRRYKAAAPPTDLATANDEAMLASDLKVDNYVALCDSDDPEYNQFHVAKVLRIDADAGEAQLHQYATKAVKLQQAVWLPIVT